MTKVKQDSKGRKGKAKSLLLGNPHKAINFCTWDTLPSKIMM